MSYSFLISVPKRYPAFLYRLAVGRTKVGDVLERYESTLEQIDDLVLHKTADVALLRLKYPGHWRFGRYHPLPRLIRSCPVLVAWKCRWKAAKPACLPGYNQYPFLKGTWLCITAWSTIKVCWSYM